MISSAFYPIGTPGRPWGAEEVAQWRSRQARQRSYRAEVVDAVERLAKAYEVTQYGSLDYDGDGYPLLAIRSRDWREDLPVALVTGGVHGYETSGVHGALLFVEREAVRYAGRVNDPNRSFRHGSPAQESAALMRLVAPLRERVRVHVDLHETTDSDEAEFRPALAARDGKAFEPGEIPDGFYTVGDTHNPQPAFQQAIIAAVAEVTHIAPADARGEIIGSPAVAPGVINYPVKSLGLCAGITEAPFVTTTEVYPDSPRATPEQCNAAQAAAVCAAIDFALSH
jgi:hypothetical protein